MIAVMYIKFSSFSRKKRSDFCLLIRLLIDFLLINISFESFYALDEHVPLSLRKGRIRNLSQWLESIKD